MRFSDIIAMSAGNLWKRKVRTILTVLGVMIGTASIVVMLSLGIGLKSAMLGEIQSQGSMLDITVNNYNYYSDNGVQMTDQTMEDFMAIDHVTEVTPMLTAWVTLEQGKYAASERLIGVSQEYLSRIPLAEGATYPAPNTSKPELLIGNGVISDFYVASTYEYPYYEDGELADVDLLNRTLFVQFESQWITDAEGNMIEQQPARKNIFPIAGLVEGTVEDYNSYSDGIYTDIDSLKKLLQDTYRGQAIPGQPTDHSGNPYRYFCYEEAVVSVDDMDNVEDVRTAISEMGFDTDSEMEWIESAQQEMLIVEAVLGGIGMISLFVAAIGIANTMMMSIYERTKEIGVMKVLGCALGNIRAMFLTEAAFIGFIGGVIGLLISFLLSFICNLVLPNLMGYGDANISIIPVWLAFVAIVFSTVIGMLAGFFPAQRATKLSPLAAIRNE